MAEWFENPQCSCLKEDPLEENSDEVSPSVRNNAITHNSVEIYFREPLLEDLPVREKKNIAPESAQKYFNAFPFFTRIALSKLLKRVTSGAG